ncbi:MAG: hypothetical protein ACTS6J_14375 [Burkholderiales bacterium]
MVARASVKNRRILLFDEASRALDKRTQTTVAHRVECLSATRVVIARLLCIVIKADRIPVIDAGKVSKVAIELNELAQKNGHFAAKTALIGKSAIKHKSSGN